jgi:hypothetical protein
VPGAASTEGDATVGKSARPATRFSLSKWVRRHRPAVGPNALDGFANEVEHNPQAPPDPVESVLLPHGPPTSEAERAQFFELYRLMVQTSEALVARRQGTNTFFLTANGVLLTALGFVVRGGADPRSHATVVAVFCLTGIIVSWAWRSLLVSFGQLNKGKFAVILRLEKQLAASVFDAEWEALGRGRSPKIYRSFTSSESRIPVVFLVIYTLAFTVALLISAGWQP